MQPALYGDRLGRAQLPGQTRTMRESIKSDGALYAPVTHFAKKLQRYAASVARLQYAVQQHHVQIAKW